MGGPPSRSRRGHALPAPAPRYGRAGHSFIDFGVLAGWGLIARLFPPAGRASDAPDRPVPSWVRARSATVVPLPSGVSARMAIVAPLPFGVITRMATVVSRLCGRRPGLQQWRPAPNNSVTYPSMATGQPAGC